MPLPKPNTSSLAGHSLYIFATRFFPALASLLVLIGYARILPKETNGDYQRFWIQLNVFYPLACFGVHAVLITYSRSFIQRLAGSISGRSYGLYASWLILVSTAFAVLMAHVLPVSSLVSFFFLLAFALSIISEAYLLVCRHYIITAVISFFYSVGFVVIHWLVLRDGFSISLLFSYLLILVVLRCIVYMALSITELKKKGEATEDTDINKVRALWLHLGVYDTTQMLFSWIDKFIISLVLTAPLSAVYYIGAQNIPFLPLMLSAAGSAVLIQMAGSKGNMSDMVSYMKWSSRLLSCIVFPLFCFLLFYRHELIITLFTEKYAAAIPVFAVAVLVLPVRAYSFTTVLQRLHKGNIINIGSIADLLLALALMYPLYRWLGLPGVALSFVITTYLQAAFYLFYSAKYLNKTPLSLIPLTNWLVKFTIFSTLLIIVRYFCSHLWSGKIVLILGGTAMLIMMSVSLIVEMMNQKKNGRDTPQATEA